MFGKNNLKFIAIATVLAGLLSPIALAADVQKDTDYDGITDQAELEIYKTDPNNADTDRDGVLDYQEILDKTNPLDSHSNKVNFTKDYFPTMWYLGRISGVVAFVMFTFVICFGLTMTSKLFFKVKFLKAPDVLESHQFTATFVGLGFLLLHIFSFVFDDYFKLKVLEAFTPFLLKRDINSSLGFNIAIPVSLGIVAFYFALMLVLTSQFRKKIVSVKIWRALHYSSFLFYILFLVHAILSGTDSQTPWMIAIYSVSFVMVISLILLRIFGKKYFLPKAPSKPVNTAPAAEIKNPPVFS